MDGLFAVAVILIAAVVLWKVLRTTRADFSKEPWPPDVTLFKGYYEPRGYTVVAVRRIGTASHPFEISPRREGRMRLYEVDLQLPNGPRETRRRGVSLNEAGAHRIWRLRPNGKVEQLF